MSYSRKNLKKAMSILDGFDALLEAKDRLSPDVEMFVRYASDCMEIALAKMQIEAAEYAKEKERQLQPLLPIFAVDQATGEVVSVEERAGE